MSGDKVMFEEKIHPKLRKHKNPNRINSKIILKHIIVKLILRTKPNRNILTKNKVITCKGNKIRENRLHKKKIKSPNTVNYLDVLKAICNHEFCSCHKSLKN